MPEMISQCPKCMTSFRVTEDQLTVAGGKVRCGYCMNVFMGHDYLISGGDSGVGVADEDVLRSLLDGDGSPASDEGAGSFNPPLAAGIETQDDYDLDSLLSQDFEDSLAKNSRSEFAPPAEDAAENFLDSAASPSGAIENSIVSLEGSGAQAEEVVGPAEGFLTSAEGSLNNPDSVVNPASVKGGVIEPDISLIEENLKFDEDDLRNSTDEDWALELLAELEGTGKYKDSTEASDAYVKELLADTEITLQNPGSAASGDSGNQAHRSGLGFEEIIVDVVPPADDHSDLASVDETSTAESGIDTADAEFTVEFSHASAAPALGQPDTEPEPGVEPVLPGEAETGRQEGGSQTDLSEASLFEDAASVYQQAAATAPEPESLTGESVLGESGVEANDELKRRTTDFLPESIDITQSPAAVESTGNSLEWKWITGSLGMVLLMLLQYGYFYWGDLTASAKTRPMLVSFCSVVGCELPPYRNLRNVTTDQLSVRSHPDSEAALIVDIILSNKAELDQPFPVLQLTFFDIRSQPVATRKFFPNEYLDGELRGLSSMPSDNPIRLALEIMDPGADAINYELNLLPTL